MKYTDIEDALIVSFSSILTSLSASDGSIRVAYQQEASPSWKQSDNILAFYLSPVDNVMAEDQFDSFKYNVVKDKIERKNIKTDVIEVNISFYGPSCRENASLIRRLIQKAPYNSNLAKLGIYPVPKTPTARYLPYEYNKQWWQRADLVLTINVLSDYTDNINRIVSVPITTITNKGDENHDVITVDTNS